MITINKHPELALVEQEIKLVRDSIIGEPALKAPENQLLYLPTPDETGDEAGKRRYAHYINRAEYENTPKKTLSNMIGMFSRKAPVVDGLPANLEIMATDIDGDGQSLEQFIQFAAREVLQVKFMACLVDFSGSTEGMSQAQAASSGARPVVKVYSRESVIDWCFGEFDGVNQLTYLKLCEVVDEIDYRTGARESKERMLMFRLVEGGVVKSESIQDGVWSDDSAIIASGQQLQFIPVVFIFDEEVAQNCIPMDFGYLYPICKKAIYRYQVKADWKEALHKFANPTPISKGWDTGDIDTFEKVNGRTNFAWGRHNGLPRSVVMDLMSYKTDDSAFVTYFELNSKEAEVLGADLGDGIQAQTATEARINLGSKLAVLNSIASNIEQALIEIFAIGGMFVGVDYEATKSTATVKLNKEFVEQKITVQERQQVVNEYTQGLVSEQIALKALVDGGIYPEEALDILNANA